MSESLVLIRKSYKSYLMRTAGILLVLSAFVRIMLGITYMHFYSFLKLRMQLAEYLYTPTVIASVLIMAGGIAEFAFGIICAIKHNEGEHLKFCIIFGAVTLLICLASNLMQLYTLYEVDSVAWITGAAVPAFGLAAGFIRSLRDRK